MNVFGACVRCVTPPQNLQEETIHIAMEECAGYACGIKRFSGVVNHINGSKCREL